MVKISILIIIAALLFSCVMVYMALAASKDQEQEDAEQEEFLRKETRKKYETK